MIWNSWFTESMLFKTTKYYKVLDKHYYMLLEERTLRYSTFCNLGIPTPDVLINKLHFKFIDVGNNFTGVTAEYVYRYLLSTIVN